MTLISCNSTPSIPNIQGSSDGKLDSLKEDPAPVKILRLTLKDFSYQIRSAGKIGSHLDRIIYCQQPGQLIECKARTGETIGSGELIARFDTMELSNRIQKTKLLIFSSQREYESQLLSYEDLLKQYPDKNAGEIKKQIAITSGLLGYEQDLRQLNYEFGKTTIAAPFTGVLADVKIQDGQNLKAGEEMFRIYVPALLEFETKILETEITNIKIGMLASVSPISDTSVKYSATVTEINPYVDENGLVDVKFSIRVSGGSNGKGNLFPGMNCMGVIEVPIKRTLLVPKEAVVTRMGKSVVFTLNNGRAKWHYVSLGSENDQEIEVTNGLKMGEDVIVSDNLQLADGSQVMEAPVKPKNQ